MIGTFVVEGAAPWECKNALDAPWCFAGTVPLTPTLILGLSNHADSVESLFVSATMMLAVMGCLDVQNATSMLVVCVMARRSAINVIPLSAKPVLLHDRKPVRTIVYSAKVALNLEFVKNAKDGFVLAAWIETESVTLVPGHTVSILTAVSI